MYKALIGIIALCVSTAYAEPHGGHGGGGHSHGGGGYHHGGGYHGGGSWHGNGHWHGGGGYYHHNYGNTVIITTPYIYPYYNAYPYYYSTVPDDDSLYLSSPDDADQPYVFPGDASTFYDEEE